jgi:hypothetical protein
MKSLKDFINESTINESNPRGEYKVIAPMPTEDCWEYYAYANNDDSQIDLEEMEEMYDQAGFANFLAYAKKKRWKKDGNGYYIIPRRTELTYDDYLSCAPHIGLFEINGDGVYLPLMHDSVKYGEYEQYLKSLNDDEDDWY